jgi:hypothetical protein
MAGFPARLTRLAWISIAAAVATIAIKTLAWGLTGSIGFLSDAAEVRGESRRRRDGAADPAVGGSAA